jgi:hypothetical protein
MSKVAFLEFVNGRFSVKLPLDFQHFIDFELEGEVLPQD